MYIWNTYYFWEFEQTEQTWKLHDQIIHLMSYLVNKTNDNQVFLKKYQLKMSYWYEETKNIFEILNMEC